MNDEHPADRLIPYLRTELPPGEARAVAVHLARCDECRAALEDFHRLFDVLANAAPSPPPVPWSSYRAEVRERIARRAAPRASRGLGRWNLALPAALAAGLVAVLVYTGSGSRTEPVPGDGDWPSPDHALLASRLDLFRRLDLVQHLDLLEDLDVIDHLDRLPARGDG